MVAWDPCPAHQRSAGSAEVVQGPIWQWLGLGVLLPQFLKDRLVEFFLEFRKSTDRCLTVRGEHEIAIVNLGEADEHGLGCLAQWSDEINLCFISGGR